MVRPAALFLLLLPSLSFAQLDTKFTFNGQNAETLKGEKQVSVTRPVGREVPSTCTRDVPYEVYECNDVTRHRQECSWVPESNHCWTENDRECRDVYRTRQECSEGPSRQVCTERPSRTVCTERPSRTVCSTSPSGQQHCTEVGGGQHCTEVGGGQSCTTVGGERTCRDVGYTDRECHNVPRQRCETRPGHNACRDVPYTENVCGNVTHYRQEEYACTRTVYDDVTEQKKVITEVNVQIITNGIVEEFPVSVVTKAVDVKHEAFTVAVKLLKEPKTLVILKKKEIVVASENKQDILVKATLVIELKDRRQLPLELPEEISWVTLDKDSQVLTIAFDEVAASGTIDLKITRDGLLSRQKTIASFKGDYPSDAVKVGKLEGEPVLMINLAGHVHDEIKNNKNILDLKINNRLSLDGEILNAKKPGTETELNGNFVEVL